MYVEADGSMILTREEGWSEVKVGRIFKSSDCLHADGKPGWISHSQYTAHLGSHKEFTKTLDNLIDKYGNLGSFKEIFFELIRLDLIDKCYG